MEKIKAKVVFRYVADSVQPCQGKLRIMLPTAENSEKIKVVFRDGHKEVMSERLQDVWGVYQEGYRVRSMWVGAKDWDDLQDRIEQEIANVLGTLSEVVERNIAMMKAKPEDWEETFFIPTWVKTLNEDEEDIEGIKE